MCLGGLPRERAREMASTIGPGATGRPRLSETVQMSARPRWLDFDDSEPQPDIEQVPVEEPRVRRPRRPAGSGATKQDAPAPTEQDLKKSDSALMTVLAQDVIVTASGGGPLLARVEVPAERLAAGPRGHRFHVVDLDLGTSAAQPPLRIHPAGKPWRYEDPWEGLYRQQQAQAATTPTSRKVRALANTINTAVRGPQFREQNVFAIAATTLATFERNLGRPIAWRSGYPQLYLVPAARVEANAFYSPEHNAILFGWLPASSKRPSVFTSLSYDVVAHEVSHAILDGLRPRFTEPGLPDQMAFHEALADLVAMLSVFQVKGVPEQLLGIDSPSARFRFPGEPDLGGPQTPAKKGERRAARAQHLMRFPLSRLAEQLGSIVPDGPGLPGSPASGDAVRDDGLYPSLRRAVELVPTKAWRKDPSYDEPHRRADVLVAAFMQTFIDMWVGRLDPLENDQGLDGARVVEEGTKAADHLLGMVLRSLDYLPPVELEFDDVIDSIITADWRLAPDDAHDYRGALGRSFESFGIKPPHHRILDEDGAVAPSRRSRPAARKAASRAEQVDDDIATFRRDPDTTRNDVMRYEHLNYAAMRTSPEEIYQFIWNNAAILEIDVRLTTVVERVLTSTRIGPDGLVVTDLLADYTQRVRGPVEDLPAGIDAPEGMTGDTMVELWGGGVLVFDQFGRFRLHQRKPILEKRRQTDRLAYLFTRGLKGRDGVYGASDGTPDKTRFALLHDDAWEASW
jgi:hypothetical protein